MTDMAMRPATQPTPVTPLASSIDIDEEISALEAHLARPHLLREAQAAEDTEPWVLDHSDDVWHGSAAVGSNAFARRCHKAGLLSAQDEVVLARRIEAGAFARERLTSGAELKRTERRGLEHVVREADEARERMIVANTRLVTKIARSLMPRCGTMQFDDLQQAGFMGLMRAVDKFDHTLGNKFSTYATWWIKQSISRAIDDESRVIRIPVHMADKSRAVDTARRRAGLTWAEAVADPSRLGGDHTVEQVESARRVLRPCSSLDQILEEVDIVDPSDATLDSVVDQMAFGQWWAEIVDHLAHAPGLGERAVAVLEMRSGLHDGEPKTLDEIGKHFGVTRERIRQIEKKALDEVRAFESQGT